MIELDITESHHRAPLSATTLQILCDFARGEVGHPLTVTTADWPAVFQAVSRNGLIGLAYHYLQHHPDREYPPQPFRDWIRATYRRAAMQMLQRYSAIRQVLQALEQAEVACLILKGPSVAYTVYPDPMLRTFSDLDLMVREQDWQQVHQALLDMGFHSPENWSRHRPKLIPQQTTYEVRYWHAGLELMVEVHYDDLLNAGLASQDLEGFWRRAKQIDIRGQRASVLAPEDQLLHLCAHCHYHGYTRLSWFADLALLVRGASPAFDWNAFVATVHKEEAHVPAYYSLLFLQKLLDVSTPAWVMAAIRPDALRRWLHERYLPEAEVLAFQPMPRPDFSFYFLPMLKRLLPDLLVMGRRREKLAYLLALLRPSPAWLRHYYGLAESEAVGPHYALHPLKLLYHYLKEIVQVALAGKVPKRLPARSLLALPGICQLFSNGEDRQ